jgi:hypothetical protein
MAAWEGVTPASSFARTPLANQTIANPAPHGAREARVHPFAFARLRMAVSERLCWRPIQPRAISQTAFEARGGIDQPRALARARGANRGTALPFL